MHPKEVKMVHNRPEVIFEEDPVHHRRKCCQIHKISDCCDTIKRMEYQHIHVQRGELALHT